MRVPKIKSESDWNALDAGTRHALSRRAACRLRDVRLSRGAGTSEFAEALGYKHNASYSHLEVNDRAVLTYERLRKCAVLCGLTVQEIIGNKKPKVARKTAYPLEVGDRKKVSQLLLELVDKAAAKEKLTHADIALNFGIKRGTESYRYWRYGRRVLTEGEFAAVTRILGIKETTAVRKALL